jgi:hypothetical protein
VNAASGEAGARLTAFRGAARRRVAFVSTTILSALIAAIVTTPQAWAGTHPRGFASTSTDSARTSPTRFSEVRVCAYEAFNKTTRTCVRDQRAMVLVSTKFGCSAVLTTRTPARLHARMTYRGVTAYEFTSRVLSPGRHGWWISYNLGTVPLPGGDWGCEFSSGSTTARVRFRSGGPTGKIIGAAACAGNDTISFGSNRTLHACRTGHSGGSIPVTDVIVCSGVLPKAASKELKIQLLSGGLDAAGPYVNTVSGPLWIVWGIFRAPSGRQAFAPGDYVCRFSIDGLTVAEKSLHLGPL